MLDWIRRHASAVTISLAGAIGVCVCVSVQPLCFDVPYGPGGRPELGSSRAPSCDVIAYGYRWALFPAAAIILAIAMLAVLHRVRHHHRWTLATICVLAAVHFAIVIALSDAVLVG